jgi:predicted DNA-binding transcriptional regulator AlpA
MSDGRLGGSAVWIDGRPLRDYLLTPREMAKHLQCSERKLERHRLMGDGPPFVKIGAAIRYPLSELEKWLTERTHRSTSETP